MSHYTFHKNECARVNNVQLFKWFGAFANVKVPKKHQDGSNLEYYSRSKNPHILRCQRHTVEEDTVEFVCPEVCPQTLTVNRPFQFDTPFDRYKCGKQCNENSRCGDYPYCLNAGISLNMRQHICCICVYKIREWLRENRHVFYIKLWHHIKQSENIEIKHTDMHGITNVDQFYNIFRQCAEFDVIASSDTFLCDEKLQLQGNTCLVFGSNETSAEFYEYTHKWVRNDTSVLQKIWKTLGFFEKIDNFMFQGNFVFETGAVQPVARDRVSYLLKTLSCRKCHEKAKDCDCTKKFELRQGQVTVNGFRHNNNEYETLIQDVKTNQQVAEKNKKRKSMEKHEDNWGENSLWKAGTDVFCEFFAHCSATTNAGKKVNEISLHDACETWLPHLQRMSEDTGLHYIHATNLLKSYLVMRQQYMKTYSVSREEGIDFDKQMHEYLENCLANDHRNEFDL
tara:strand:+ start:50 stop:1408 length:1359 start_codon:yes stop_codon:yes gene_type:complete